MIANGDDQKTGISGDPQIVRLGDVWVMFYFGTLWEPKAFDTFACSYDLVHWTKWTGVVYHFYCAVGDQGRVIGLATSKDLKP